MSKSRRPADENPLPAKAIAPVLNANHLRWILPGLALLAIGGYLLADWWTGLPANAEAKFVGRQTCVQCHQSQAEKFADSHHDKAMDLATPATVLGDFNNAELTHHGITSRMFQRDGRYYVNTEGPTGELADFEVKYVFGVDPLQQYMVEFDRRADAPADEVSRVQVLRISWDTQRKQWFHLDPPDVKEKLAPDDDLHWTGIAQRWNTMCADCHSTNLQRNFDPVANRYHTTFSEIDVSCEACHGPGSLHVQLAQQISPFWDRQRGYAIAASHGKNNLAEIETCAPCHARRQIIHADFRPGKAFHDYFANETLHRTAYHADGQNLDEVYEYGSFTQSKMFHKNIRCSDCHDPHSTKLKFQGNQLCTSCHAHPAGKFDTVAHHHHQPGSPGAACVECHMPHTTYMQVDPRRDHGLRVPRPDLSLQYHTPNACTQCHLNDVKDLPAEKRASLKQYADWLSAKKQGDETIAAALKQVDTYCANALAKWYPPQKRKEDLIVPAITAAWQGELASQDALAALIKKRELSDIVRATAASELSAFARPGSVAIEASLAALKDDSPQVRAAAVRNLEGLPPDEMRKSLVPLLSDGSRMVRTETARVLAQIERTTLRNQEHDLFQTALEEYFAELKETDDRAGSHLARGVIYERLNELDAAEACYRTALRIEPRVTGPRSNLAALFERRIEIAQQQAQQAAQARDREAAIAFLEPVAGHQALVEHWRKEELALYARDVRLAPKNGPVQYRYGLLLYLQNDFDAAVAAIQQAIAAEPKQAEFRLTLALLLEKQRRFPEALEQAKQALALWPSDRGYQETVERLQNSVRN